MFHKSKLKQIKEILTKMNSVFTRFGSLQDSLESVIRSHTSTDFKLPCSPFYQSTNEKKIITQIKNPVTGKPS